MLQLCRVIKKNITPVSTMMMFRRTDEYIQLYILTFMLI